MFLTKIIAFLSKYGLVSTFSHITKANNLFKKIALFIFGQGDFELVKLMKVD